MVFDLQPRLASELLLLRQLSAADFDPLYAVAADPAVWEQHPSKDRTEKPAFGRWFDDALACGGALVAVDRATGEVFGTSRFVLHGPDEAEIGWTFLARSRWGGLRNGEMRRLMLKHAFDEVQQVRFTVHSENTRSQESRQTFGRSPERDGFRCTWARRERRVPTVAGGIVRYVSAASERKEPALA